MALYGLSKSSAGHESSKRINKGDDGTQIEKHSVESGDFYYCLRPFLILGRFIGILPIMGIFESPKARKGLDYLEFK